MTRNDKVLTVVLAVAAGVFALLAIASAALYSHRVAVLQRENSKLLSSSDTLSGKIESLESAKEQLLLEVAELESKLADAGSYYSDEIAALELQIEMKTAEAAALEADIAKYRTVFDVDVLAQARLIDEIIEYIETKCPYVKVTLPPENEGDAEKTEWVLISELILEEREKLTPETPLFTEEELIMSGLTAEELTEKRLFERVISREDVSYPSVSIYYEDILTGYHFDYNGDVAYSSASVIKAPYILSVLEAVSADEKRYLDELSSEGKTPEQIDTDGDGTPDRVKIEYSNPAYDLYETVVYDKETMLKSGSGKIQDMEDGTEFTYLDFMKYTLTDSDNIAYAQLRSRFGYSTMIALANRVGANIAGSTMTAKGAGKLFREIYEFTKTNETYGPVMREAMIKSGHTVIIPYAVSPTKAMHKYGWDEASYHDAAIVLFDDHPYVLSVFSDLYCGGNEVNAYLREIVKMVNKLHKGFYEG